MREPQYLAALRKLEATATALENAVVAGANAYANGENPIVAKHFTAGNQERYGWVPLSPKYAAQKGRNTVHLGGGRTGSLVVRTDARRAVATMQRVRDADVAQARQRGVGKAGLKLLRGAHDSKIRAYLKQETQGRAGSRLEVAGGPTHRNPLIFGTTVAAASHMPLLVRTGLLRDAVTRVKHAIRRDGNTAFISFAGLPEYAQYLEHGTPKMPRRSPVDPCEADAVEVRAAMQRYIDSLLGTGKANVAVSSTTMPNQARMTP